MTMRTAALGIIALALASHGRRVQKVQRSSDQEPNVMKALASLLLAGNPEAGWQSIAKGPGRISRSSLADRQFSGTATVARCSPASMGLGVGETFPASALSKWGVRGKNAVVFFFGADDAPSCSKQIAAFDAAKEEFGEAGVSLVGVRNAAGVKDGTGADVKLVVDQDDAVRNEIGIEKDLFGLLGGRETYVLDKKGTVVEVHNNQFDPESHIKVARKALDKLPEDKGPLDDLLEIFR